ncbi:MAG: FmdB family transcriptional regulator [Dehalococcoidia bacterium]|nr:FmdB family transcriptional regulator [Dehalococcoidia bacterium]
MPTYEYLCDACGSRYEKREGFDAPASQKCPTCGKRANRVLHAPPIVFKGAGFYKTDSRGGSAGRSEAAATDAPAEPAAEATAATDGAKPKTDSTATEAAAAG